MRFLSTLCGLFGLILLVMAGPALAQTGFDRRGGDYTNFPIRSGDPALCAARCERDGRCRAWSFSYPRTENALAVCWLKNRVPPRIEDKCCVSGVRGAGVTAPRTSETEFSIDRWGGDYRFFDTAADPAGAACKAACEGEERCRAWSYVRPGYIAPTARCYLKDKIPRPRPRPCCISGVVR